jgi:hypothetical protein
MPRRHVGTLQDIDTRIWVLFIKRDPFGRMWSTPCPNGIISLRPQGATAPISLLIIEVSRSHSDIPHSVGFVCTSDEPDAKTFIWQYTTLTTVIHVPGGFRTHNPRDRAATGIGRWSKYLWKVGVLFGEFPAVIRGWLRNILWINTNMTNAVRNLSNSTFMAMSCGKWRRVMWVIFFLYISRQINEPCEQRIQRTSKKSNLSSLGIRTCLRMACT